MTLKRWRRFRLHRRAFWSLCILVGLYALSLVSELIANNRPLYVRFAGNSYFPVFFDYAQDTFLGDGIATSPDYKKLRENPVFMERGGKMCFAVIPFGPHEILDPAAVPHDPGVLLTVRADAQVGNVNVDSNLVVQRGQAAGWFFGVGDDAVRGVRVADAMDVPQAFREAVVRRLRNEESTTYEVTLTNRATGRAVQISMAEFSQRSAAPETVRVSFMDRVERGEWWVRLGLGGRAEVPLPSGWMNLAESDRERLREIAEKRMSGNLADTRIVLGGVNCLVKATREEIRWPYRPVPGHRLGIDSAGRDVLVRLLYGLRISLSFGLLLVAASMSLGIGLGLVQGYYGGVVDIAGQRLTEIWHAIPLLYVLMLLGAVLGTSFALLLVSYFLFNWIGISYYMRAEALRLRRLPFVDAARCLGLPDRKIMLRHILPNALTPVVTFFPFSLVGAIGLLAALDYLGFGLPALTPSWGELLRQAQQYRWAWWLILYPSLALFVVMMLGVFVGEGVRDAYDPRPKSRLE